MNKFPCLLKMRKENNGQCREKIEKLCKVKRADESDCTPFIDNTVQSISTKMYYVLCNICKILQGSCAASGTLLQKNCSRICDLNPRFIYHISWKLFISFLGLMVIHQRNRNNKLETCLFTMQYDK